MGVNYFSDEQVKELEKNPYVKKVSIKSITILITPRGYLFVSHLSAFLFNVLDTGSILILTIKLYLFLHFGNLK